MSGGTNPYAPPAVADPSAERGWNWYTDLPAVYARNGAVLPEVCMETGRRDDLERIKRSFLHTNPFVTVWLTPLFFLVLMPGFTSMAYIALGLWMAVLVISIAVMIFSFRSKRINFACWIHGPLHRARRTRRRIRLGLHLSAVALIAAAILAPIRPGGNLSGELYIPALVLACFLMLGTAIWHYADREKNHLAAGERGWVRIGNVHLDAIRILRRIERERDAAPQTSGAS